MSAFISWYIVITILGWLTFPLAYHLFPALTDRGYTLSRAFSLLIWGYVFWLFASLGVAQNDIGGLLLALLILIGLSVWATIENRKSSSETRKLEIVAWLNENRRILISTELLFLIAFALMAWVRANNPEIFSWRREVDGDGVHQCDFAFANLSATRPLAFGICHFLLLFWLCNDCHARKAGIHTSIRGSQLNALAYLRLERSRWVWIAIQSLICVSPLKRRGGTNKRFSCVRRALRSLIFVDCQQS